MQVPGKFRQLSKCQPIREPSQQTRLDRTERIDRLMLALVLACWWVIGRGIWVDRMGLRRQVDRAKHPKCSLFTIGLRWINQLLNRDKMPDVVLVPVL